MFYLLTKHAETTTYTPTLFPRYNYPVYKYHGNKHPAGTIIYWQR